MVTTKSIVIGATPSDLYHACTGLESLPAILQRVRSVHWTGETTSHWIVEGPDNRTLEWDAEWTRLEPGRRIAWNTFRDGDIRTSGQITFNPLPHGQTELTLMLKVVSEEVERSPYRAEKLVDQTLRP
jgi:uncharacterized membrane protein